MQVLREQMDLTFVQRLQLRIAKERGIDIDSLKDDQFKPLKQYKHLQKKEEVFNNLLDFFDSY